METHPGRQSDREALRAVIVDALARLPESRDAQRDAEELMRALDAYLDDHQVPREPPVMDYRNPPPPSVEQRWVLWLVLASGITATVVAAVALDGGWLTGVVILAIWATALLALATA